MRKNRRGGGTNSLTRLRLKPELMVGGYAQFTAIIQLLGPGGFNRDTYVIVRQAARETEMVTRKRSRR